MSVIGPGLVLLVGIGHDDDETTVDTAVEKVIGLRVFTDDAGKMNRSITDTGGEILVVSQFTLLGDVKRGRRPSFTDAAPPDLAAPLIERMVKGLQSRGVPTGAGVFGASMEVDLVNEGPVTLVFDFENATRD